MILGISHLVKRWVPRKKQTKSLGEKDEIYDLCESTYIRNFSR